MKSQSFKASSGLAVWCGVLLVFFACCLNGMAQSSTSSVTGTVVDPQGNVVPGATVTLTNAQKNFTRTQTTTDNGSFAFSLIPPGQYQIEAEAKGFILQQRLPVYPEFIPSLIGKQGLLSQKLRTAAAGDGLARRAA